MKPSSSLAVMPLGALLPRLGSSERLAEFRDELAGRLEELQLVGQGDEREAYKEHTAEEMMLLQVVQWLDLGAR